MRKFSVQIELVAEMAVYNPFDFFLEDQATHFPFSYEPALRKDLRPFLEPCPRTPKLSAFIEMLKREILGRPEALTPAAPHPSGVYQGGHFPGAGWIGLDPTSGLLAGEGHIPLSCTPEPSSAAPITGVIDECTAKLHHEMRVARIYESPRVTKPYTEEHWAKIQSLGHVIDAD